jgi:hypothetical protein
MYKTRVEIAAVNMSQGARRYAEAVPVSAWTHHLLWLRRDAPRRSANIARIAFAVLRGFGHASQRGVRAC